jgi:hypothetical protein
MGTLYQLTNENQAGQIAGPSTGVTTSATLFTLLQVQATAGAVMRVVEWGVSFNASALAAGFSCDLMDSGTVAATVTAFAAVDVTVLNPDTPAQSGTTTGVPFILSTTASGYTSTAEGTITAPREFDVQIIEPIGGYYKQFPLGREPLITPGHNLRVRVHGDGTTRCTAYVIVEV